MKNNLLREAVRISREKLPSHPQLEYWPHYSFIVQNNKILDWGYNTEDTPSVHFGYHERIHWGMPKMHSEVNAFRAAKGLLNPNKGFEVINIRLKRKANLANSSPCSCCFNFLQTMGCSCVYFSTDCGFARIGL